jgi:hypothetical protein
MFSYLSPEARVGKDHPLGAVRSMTDEILSTMSPLFDAMYAEGGRPSIPPEKLLRAQLLQMFFSVRSERLLMEEIDLQHPVPLVRWPELGRACLGRNDVYEEPRPIAGSGGGEGVSGSGGGACTRGGSDFRRALYGRWNASGSVGKPEEFPAQRQREDCPRQTIPAIRRWTFTERSAPTRRMNRQPIRMPSWRARPRARRRS